MTNIVRYICLYIPPKSHGKKKSNLTNCILFSQSVPPIFYCFPLISEGVPFQGGERNLKNYIPSFCAHLFGCTYTCLMRDSFIHMKEAHHMFL